jgi:hypothetical protein
MPQKLPPGAGSLTRKNSMLISESKPEKGKTPSQSFRYPVEAHHAISCSVVQKHAIAQKAIDAGYNVNNGKNCIYLPACFGHMMRDKLQRHKGGHFDAYYKKVKEGLDDVWKKNKSKDPCDPTDRKSILSGLENLQSDIKKKLSGPKPKLWLYEWSKDCFKKDYREEGGGSLEDWSWGPGTSDAYKWMSKHVSPKRKTEKGTKNVNTWWYQQDGYPVPGSIYS